MTILLKEITKFLLLVIRPVHAQQEVDANVYLKNNGNATVRHINKMPMVLKHVKSPVFLHQARKIILEI